MAARNEESRTGGGGAELEFETGALSPQEIEGIFNTLPVDITFIGKDEDVKFFSKPGSRIFARPRSVIGRKVQNCHPQKSVHIVNRLIEELKNGKRDVARFWINVGGRLVYIRYFPVRGRDGAYLGTLEVTQDVTDVKKLEGEKRLLDEP